MNKPLKVGIIGDFNQNLQYHIATNQALGHAAEALRTSVDSSWISTVSLAQDGGEAMLEEFDALWCSPGSPYKSMDGALHAIRFAREKGRPFFGT